MLLWQKIVAATWLCHPRLRGAHILWAILLVEDGGELACIALAGSPVRDDLPRCELDSFELRHNASAMIVVRDAADPAFIPCAAELRAIITARHTLGAIGLRRHDYILWCGERCVSLRQARQL